ncbi:MAG TPA: hypothetical protein DCE27_05610 [Xanthomarina gelatinilytica]|nr:hypothetical protein [Xanthomarina gelatinilytica]
MEVDFTKLPKTTLVFIVFGLITFKVSSIFLASFKYCKFNSKSLNSFPLPESSPSSFALSLLSIDSFMVSISSL